MITRDPHWLEIWKNHLCPMRPNGGSVAMDSAGGIGALILLTQSGSVRPHSSGAAASVC